MSGVRATAQWSPTVSARQRSFAVRRPAAGGQRRTQRIDEWSDAAKEARSQPNLTLCRSAGTDISPRAHRSEKDQHNVCTAKPVALWIWGSEAYVLPHKALRHHLGVLLAMMQGATTRCTERGGARELELLARSWRTFEAFVREYLAFESDVLLRWAHAHDDVAMASSRDQCERHIRQVRSSLELRRHVDSRELLLTVTHEARTLADTLHTHLNALHAHLTRHTAASHAALDHDALTRAYVAYIWRGGHARHHLVLLTACMDARTRSRWTRTYVRALSRLRLRRWQRAAEREHAMVSRLLAAPDVSSSPSQWASLQHADAGAGA
ncbi:unnamed protein product, partial [Agarophyton chilense]